jgi:hypothetical protein
MTLKSSCATLHLISTGRTEDNQIVASSAINDLRGGTGKLILNSIVMDCLQMFEIARREGKIVENPDSVKLKHGEIQRDGTLHVICRDQKVGRDPEER